MVLAVEQVRNRLHRSTGALEDAGIPYGVIGGNAVAAWVSKIDPAAVRNTVDIDLLIRRDDLPKAKAALESVGFVDGNVLEVATFLDGPHGNPRNAVRLYFAGEKVKANCHEAAPDLASLDRHETFRIVTLEPLVRMKLNSFRIIDRVHLRDMIDVGLVDVSWPARFPEELGSRLQEVLDNAE
jgi:hypothetical protein